MKRFSYLATAAVLALAACGGSDKPTETAPAPPPVESEAAAEPAAEEPASPAAETTAAPAAEGEAYTPTDEEQAKAEELTAVMVALGDAAEANAEDCGALAEAFVTLQTDNEALFMWAEEFANSDPAKGQWLQSQIMPAFQETQPKLQPAMMSCQNDPAFQQAMQQLSGGM